MTASVTSTEAQEGSGTSGFWGLTLGSIGVVFGDIGTSPLYAFREAASNAAGHGQPVTRAIVLGVLSLILWALFTVVTAKYVLLLLRADGRLWENVRWFASSKVDFYTGSDTVKSSDVEITELLASAYWNRGAFGAGLTASRFLWPELKRAEYQNLPVELVRLLGHLVMGGIAGFGVTLFLQRYISGT